MYKSDSKSARSKRRKNRTILKEGNKIKIVEFKGSRPNRRATRRLEARLKDYEKLQTDNAFTKPGAINHW